MADLGRVLVSAAEQWTENLEAFLGERGTLVLEIGIGKRNEEEEESLGGIEKV